MYTPIALARLPKGDCRFITPNPQFPGQRCACVGFRKVEGIPGSSCECGHQACFHERHPSADRITRQEYDVLIGKIEWLENALHKADGRGGVEERLAALELKVDDAETSRELDSQANARAVDGAYMSLNKLERETREVVKQITSLTSDREKTLDLTEHLQNEQSKLQDDVKALDQDYHHMQDRFDSFEREVKERSALIKKRRASRGFSLPDSKRCSGDELPNGGRMSGVESAASQSDHYLHRFRAVFIPPSIVYGQAPAPGSNTERRLSSRGLIRTVEVHGPTAKAFSSAIEMNFVHLLRHKRRWMPLGASHLVPRSRDLPTRLQTLAPDQIRSDKWDMQFLDVHCVVDEDRYGNSMYLTLLGEDLTWDEIEALPVQGHPQLEAWQTDIPFNGVATEALTLNDLGTTLVPSEPSTRASSATRSSPNGPPKHATGLSTVVTLRNQGIPAFDLHHI